MGENRKYSGFTLVEMLIVMGIIIILMVIGITAGRFAINRANDITHRNAVDELYTSLLAYYTDERKYPDDCGGSYCTVPLLVSADGAGGDGYLVPYIDRDSFDGGSTATYYYGVGGDGGDQAVLGCVTLRGDSTENADGTDGAVYCSGNGIGEPTMSFEGTLLDVPVAEMTYDTYNSDGAWIEFHTAGVGDDWDGDDWL